MDEVKEYDVFISYSRRDYVDENKKIIPGNIVSQIKEVLEENEISYWMDEKGIFNGDEYAKQIARYIRRSKLFLFISTANSNASEWTSDEIATARMYKKKILPFKYDDTLYNEDVILFIAKLDFINYYENPEHALLKLLDSIKKSLKELEEAKRQEEELKLQKLREEEELRKRKEEEEKKEEVKKEIKIHAEDCRRLIVQQETIIKQLVNKNIFVGHESKICPVCNTSVSLSKHFCEKCGWQFPTLYSLDGSEIEALDEVQLSIARTNWQSLGSIVELQSAKKDLQQNIQELVDKNKYLTDSYNHMSKQCDDKTSELEEKKSEIDTLHEEITDLKVGLNACKKELSEKELENSHSEEQHKVIIADYEKRINDIGSECRQLKQENHALATQITELLNEKRKISENQKKTEQRKGATILKSTNLPVDSELIKPIVKDPNISLKNNRAIKTLEDAFAIIESCCDRSPIQDNFDFNKAKLSLGKLKNMLGNKYNVYISKSAIIACKNIGELKHLILQYCSKS